MAVDKGINQNETIEVAKVGTEVQMSGPATDDRFLIEEGGSAVMNPEQVQEQVDFGSNLAEFMEDDELEMLSNELRSEYESDKTSREEWEMGYTKGLDLLGFKYEERSRPFDGASGVYHPLLSESVVQFQAQAYKEMLPAGGPVRTQLVGIRTPQSEAQADRVKEFMNYYITDVMEEYTPELDQMLFYLPLAGSTFKKVYYDENLGRAVSKFVPAEHLVVPYETSDLETCPNITQTLENNPAIIHGGPFANIAHGCNSVIATKAGLKLADYVVTEAGFGADMGAEKALQIKAGASGVVPDCIVLNVTGRSMKLHGGAFGMKGSKRPSEEQLVSENVEAVSRGSATNLDRHITNLANTGLPVIVSINRFHSDTDAELKAITDSAIASGATEVVLFEGHAKGGEGAVDLARAVVSNSEIHISRGRPYRPFLTEGDDARARISKIGTELYGAGSVSMSDGAIKALKMIEEWGFGNLPVCMAKTQYSFSHRADLLGSPHGFELPVREIRLNAGAGFIVVVCGSMMTMPGLPSKPGAAEMDIDEDGELFGVFG